MKMKKWEAVALQEFSQWFMMDIDYSGNWIFTDMTLGTFMQPLKDTKEYWIFFVEMIYKLYKCDMLEFPDDEFPIRMLVGTKKLEEFYTNSIEEFCYLLASRFEYRKSDYAHEPYIYPKKRYRELIKKYANDDMDYISTWYVDPNKIDEEIENFEINEEFINEIEKIFEENGVEWKDKEKFLEKNETPKSEEIFLKKPKKPIEQTYDSIRDWLLPLLRKDDKIIFPKEEFLERVKLFDEAEKLRAFNVIKSAVEHDNYCVKFEENKTIRGYEAIKVFGEMLGIAVEEEIVEKMEETEVEEEKKLTPQQLRKKYFLKRMKGENK